MVVGGGVGVGEGVGTDHVGNKVGGKAGSAQVLRLGLKWTAEHAGDTGSKGRTGSS